MHHGLCVCRSVCVGPTDEPGLPNRPNQSRYRLRANSRGPAKGIVYQFGHHYMDTTWRIRLNYLYFAVMRAVAIITVAACYYCCYYYYYYKTCYSVVNTNYNSPPERIDKRYFVYVMLTLFTTNMVLKR